jgi:hypothetical protein
MEANYIDLPTILIWAFWLGFALLVIYLRREDKREGYPLESDREGVTVQGFPAVPSPRPARVKHPALVKNPDAGNPHVAAVATGAARAGVVSDTVTTTVIQEGSRTVVRQTEVVETEDETIVVERVDVVDNDEEEEV